MKNSPSKLTLVAGIMLALVFTFGCSSGGGGSNEQSYKYCITADGCLDGPFTASDCKGQLSNSCPNGSSPSVGGSSSSKGGGVIGNSSSGGNGQGVSFNENSQIYFGIWDKEHDVYYMYDTYNISGDIIDRRLNVHIGSVTNGIVHLELPTTIPAEYLKDFSDYGYNVNCTDYPNGIKWYEAEKIALYTDGSSTGNSIGDLFITEEHRQQEIWYWYFSKAGKITCNRTARDGWVGKYNIDAKTGWNRIYYRGNGDTGESEFSTNNILTKEVMWILDTPMIIIPPGTP